MCAAKGGLLSSMKGKKLLNLQTEHNIDPHALS